MGQSARSNVPCVVLIFVTNESEIMRSSPIDGTFFFQFARNKCGLLSRTTRYFDLLYSLLFTRLKKDDKNACYMEV